MSWFEIRITPDAARNTPALGRKIIAFDTRSKQAILKDLVRNGHVELQRAGLRQGRTTHESRGIIIVLHPHVISIEDRLDLNASQPQGPTKYKVQVGGSMSPEKLAKKEVHDEGKRTEREQLRKWADVIEPKE